MYLTAQRVVAPKSGRTGINVYHYVHPGRTWMEPPSNAPDEDAGELRDKSIEVPAGGNRVRSYVDMVAPDDVDADELARSFEAFTRRSAEQDFPWVGRVGRCLFRVQMDRQLAAGWRHELGALLTAIAKHLDK